MPLRDLLFLFDFQASDALLDLSDEQVDIEDSVWLSRLQPFVSERVEAVLYHVLGPVFQLARNNSPL